MVVVQLKTEASTIPLKAGMVRPRSKTAIGSTGLYGISLKFPGNIIPSFATSEAGSEGEQGSQHRIPIYIDNSTGKKTTIYKPNMLLRSPVFSSGYDVQMFYLDCDHEPLAQDTLDQIHSISLTFHCEVDAVLPA